MTAPAVHPLKELAALGILTAGFFGVAALVDRYVVPRRPSTFTVHAIGCEHNFTADMYASALRNADIFTWGSVTRTMKREGWIFSWQNQHLLHIGCPCIANEVAAQHVAGRADADVNGNVRIGHDATQ